MDYFYYSYLFILGSVIGSFLNVCILRTPKKESFVTGRSICPSCNNTLKWYHLIPIFSFFAQRGQCAFCKEKISWQYPFVEALTGFLFLGASVRFGFTPYCILMCIFISVLIVLSGIDILTLTIPNPLCFVIFLLGVVTILLDPSHFISGLIGFFLISVPMFLIALLLGGFGGGDIKLCAACGFFLGWQSILIGFFIACILAAIYSVYLLAKKKATGKSSICFGPFLSAGFLSSAFFGTSMLTWYLNLFSL
ncbi:MAG: prepilin peptidase [Lachnospiraceae bacterium]